MFFDINKTLCTVYTGLDPIRLLDYPAEDVFDLINGLILYNDKQPVNKSDVIRKPAGDDWF